jgi:hypothetical protein
MEAILLPNQWVKIYFQQSGIASRKCVCCGIYDLEGYAPGIFGIHFPDLSKFTAPAFTWID